MDTLRELEGNQNLMMTGTRNILGEENSLVDVNQPADAVRNSIHLEHLGTFIALFDFKLHARAGDSLKDLELGIQSVSAKGITVSSSYMYLMGA